MKFNKALALCVALILMTSCSSLRSDLRMAAPTVERVATPPVPQAAVATTNVAAGDYTEAKQNRVLAKTEPATIPTAAASQAFDRKIIRNADLIIELDDPADTQRKLTTIAESLGGFVVTSEAKLNGVSTANAPSTVVTVTVRVPSAQFNAAIEKLHGLGGRILQEKITGQDVTEEYIDLEARARTQRALEAQMMEILKRAGKISDALEVQNQIAAVRTEIERLEGRQRFLANQAALSTLNITLHTPTPIVMATTAKGFWHQVKQAVGDGVDLASNITLGVIQFVITLIPILLLIVLPLWLLWRLARPHVAWPKKADVVAPSTDAE